MKIREPLLGKPESGSCKNSFKILTQVFFAGFRTLIFKNPQKASAIQQEYLCLQINQAHLQSLEATISQIRHVLTANAPLPSHMTSSIIQTRA